MTKAEMIGQLADATGESQATTERVVDGLTDLIQATLAKGGEVSIPGLGKFETATRSARPGRNPATGEAMQIEAKTVAKFRPAKALKDAAAG